MKTFDADAVDRALPFERLVPAVRSMFARGCVVPPRHVHEVAAPDGGSMTTLVMPAWEPGAYFGLKTIHIAPGNAARGLAGLHAAYTLFDAVTGVPLAQMDGGRLTTRRTAAASALAASYLARSDASRLLVVGAGAIAAVLPAAYRSVLPVKEVRIWARVPERAAALVRALQGFGDEHGVEVRVASDLAKAAAWADMVSCATLSTAPLIQGEWLSAGSHLDLIGSFTPAMREVDDACFAQAQVWVDIEEALTKSGDLLGPMARGVFAPDQLQGTLEGLCRGMAPRRQNLAERTLFKSVGTALEDLAAARLVFEQSP